MNAEFYWVAIALTTIVSASRLTRLLTFDVFPPVRLLRETWGEVMDAHPLTRPWVVLFFCPWCMAIYPTLALVLWGWLADWDTLWWIVNGSLAGSYLAAMLMVRDGDNSGDDEIEES